MFITVAALISRILSNPAANALQKILSEKYSSISINVYSYFFLSLFCIVWIICASTGFTNLSNPDIAIPGWKDLSYVYWCYAALAGILCTLGSVCLIKALQLGEMSVLGPINSYKCLVGLFFGWLLLGEIPHFSEIFGVILIIFGSWYIFNTENGGFKFKLLLRKDIVLRFCALFFTGCEAVVLKKIILMSSVEKSFILWCFSGFIFSLLLMCVFRQKFAISPKNDIIKTIFIAIFLGIMQFSTNIVFERLNVGLSLALFQLSSLVSVFFGYKIFKEKNFIKKLIGSVIMIAGSCFILL